MDRSSSNHVSSKGSINNKSSTSSREKISVAKKSGQSRKFPSSVRSSRNQAAKSIRGANSTSSSAMSQESGNGYFASSRIVLDGRDVTPKSLLFPSEDPPHPSQISKDMNPNNSLRVQSVNFGGYKPTSIRSSTTSNSSDQKSSINGRSSVNEKENAGGFKKRGGWHQDLPVVEAKLPQELEIAVVPSPSGGNKKPTAIPGSEKVVAKVEKVKPKLTSKELNELVDLHLSETPTETLLHIVGVCVGVDSADHKVVTEQNEKYNKLLENKVTCLDMYQGRHAQTLNLQKKEKEIQAKPVETHDMGCGAASWDIWDTENQREQEIDVLDAGNAHHGLKNPDGSARHHQGSTVNSKVDEMVALSLATPGCLISLDAQEPPQPSSKKGAKDKPVQPADEDGRDGKEVIEERETRAIMESSELLESLRTVERSIQQNVFHKKHLQYRAVNTLLEKADLLDKKMSDLKRGEDGTAQDVAPIAESSSDAAPNKDLENMLKNPSSATLTSMDQDGEAATAGAEGAAPEPGTGPASEEKTSTGGETPADSSLEPTGTESTIATNSGGNPKVDRKKSSRRSTVMAGKNGADGKGDSDRHTLFVDRGPKLERLWQFKCAETEGRNISAMVWNHANPDLLAVAYGQFEFSNQKDGAILFWTLKNPEYPERIIRTSSGVCSLDFSRAHPSLLAVGMYNGNIALYDLRNPDVRVNGGPAELPPILESAKLDASNQHTDAVWQIRWVARKDSVQGRDQEVLVSISMDGRITEWSLKKGLTSVDLMVLKRVNSATQHGVRAGEGIISRTASGLCFDFPNDDASIYYAGTELGSIHKCSCGYNEQYLENYFGHAGPVNKVKCSPFLPGVFLTCSSDWTVRLWDSQKTDAVLTFQAVDLSDVVHDVTWSPFSSTVFGSVTGDGRVEIWDLAQNTLDPVITSFVEQPKQEEQNSSDGKGAPSTVAGDDSSEGRAATPPSRMSDRSGVNSFSSKSSKSKLVDGKTASSKAPASSGVKTKPPPANVHYTALAFSENAPVIVVGDSNGTIDVFRLSGSGFGVPEAEFFTADNIEFEASRLSEAMYPDRFVMSTE